VPDFQLWLGRPLVGLLAILLAALVTMLVSAYHPLLEAVTSVRAHLGVVALVPAIGLLLLHRWALAGLATAVGILLLAPIIPYLRPAPAPVFADSKPITVMQYNVFFGSEDYAAIADHIDESKADVVVLHELLPAQWDGLEPLLDRYPHRLAAPLSEADGQAGGGMAIVSQTPLDRVPVDPSISPKDRVILVAETQIEGEPLRVIGLHPFASRHERAKVELRERQLAGTAAIGRNSAIPTVILTDLNIAPTSPDYQGFLDDLGWQDPHQALGWQASWPTWLGPAGIPIDHIFVSDTIALHGARTGHGAGSDHKSLIAEMSIMP